MRISPVDDCVWINGEATLMIDGDTPEEARQAALILDNHDRLTEENAKLREVLERLVNPDNCKKDIIHIISNAESLLNQLKDQNNDK
jgi:hypothetical protein